MTIMSGGTEKIIYKKQGIRVNLHYWPSSSWHTHMASIAEKATRILLFLLRSFWLGEEWLLIGDLYGSYKVQCGCLKVEDECKSAVLLRMGKLSSKLSLDHESIMWRIYLWENWSWW